MTPLERVLTSSSLGSRSPSSLTSIPFSTLSPPSLAPRISRWSTSLSGSSPDPRSPAPYFLSRNFSRFPPDSFIGNPLLRGNWLGSISSLGTSKFKAIFSRTAVVCLILGFMMLLSMATLELGKLCLQKL
ncbi:uncharacterized protein [Coffea arabica]|uniref:Uncharacterized protein isoform X1 n=1 Tax=Coffea arabica TaxID=13443 RepID=A0A6P6U260_COFAR|nr:LRR receptor-like serine/threonine-protein kinase ERL1 [Coffea arabica]